MYDQVSPNSWRLNPQLLSTTETNEPEKLSLACQQSLKPVLRYRSFLGPQIFYFFPENVTMFLSKKKLTLGTEISQGIYFINFSIIVNILPT